MEAEPINSEKPTKDFYQLNSIHNGHYAFNKITYIPEIVHTKTITEKDLDLLQRYDKDITWYTWDIVENENWRYVEWDSLVQLLK